MQTTHSISALSSARNVNASPSADRITPHSLELFGLKIHDSTIDDAVSWATKLRDETETAAFLNVNSINLSFDYAHLADAINDADRVFADGSGVRLGAKHLGVELLDNVNGTDMLLPLCYKAAALGRRIYLLGGQRGVAEAAAASLSMRIPGLIICGARHGYFEKKGHENQQVIRDINAAKPDILLVGFGSPDQEQWLCNNRHALHASAVLAVGGLFDFFSGRIPRAPLWMRKKGVEWIWRLMQEPAAKFKRYVIGNPRYLWKLYSSRPSDHAIGYVSPVTKAGLPTLLQRIAAAIAIVALSPILLLFTGLVAATSRGPIFYSQVRVGKQGRRFRFFKFRSMYMPDDPKYIDPANLASDREGICKKYAQDPRVTWVGRFMRKYSIDELPQLFNVLLGDMAMIGPRPALVCEVDAYEHRMYERFNVMPGLTGLWQVSGRADTTFDEQIQLDLSYVNKQSWIEDLRILLATLPAVLFARGAY